MWQRWPPLSWHALTLPEAARIAEAYADHMKLIEPLLKQGRLL